MTPQGTVRAASHPVCRAAPAANADDDAHGRLIDILTEALQKARKEEITKQDVFPAVSDFWPRSP
jgi:hypothetical protein